MLSNLLYCVASTSTYFLISQAAVVRLPLSDHKFLAREQEQKTAFSKWPHAAQSVLQTEAGSAPLSDISVFGYGVDVAIGTPPQTIHAILDINWDTFVVQDTKCQSYSCESGNETAFNSSASTSYQPTHQRSRLVYANAIFEGSIAEDTLNVNGIAIPGQRFLDATEIRSRTFIDFYFGYRAMLGFAPASGRRAAFPSPWESLVDNGLVDRDVFSIVPIPGLRDPYEPRTGGELVLGGYPTGLDEKDALHLPLKSSTKYPWATSLESMSVGNLTTFYDTDEATAYFLTTWPSIFVPRRFGKQLMLWLGNLEPFGILFQKFDCEKREKFPDWTFGIGGRNISLGPFQYTFELNVTGDDGVETVCLLGMLPEDGDGDVVGLGWPFWESFRGLAFERDNRRISLFL